MDNVFCLRECVLSQRMRSVCDRNRPTIWVTETFCRNNVFCHRECVLSERMCSVWENVFCLWQKQTYYISNRHLLQGQKRPATAIKETYYRNTRDPFICLTKKHPVCCRTWDPPPPPRRSTDQTKGCLLAYLFFVIFFFSSTKSGNVQRCFFAFVIISLGLKLELSSAWISHNLFKLSFSIFDTF